MSFLRSWILGITSCALLLGAVNALLPESSGKRAARFAGGLLLMLVLLKPVKDIRITSELLDPEAYRQTVSALALELRENAYEELSDNIANSTAAYIESAAESLGIAIRAEVETECVGGVPVPVRVTLLGEKNAALSRRIESELGITGEKQIWIETGK